MTQRKRLFLWVAALTAGSFFTFGEGALWAIDPCGNGICYGTATPPETCDSCPEDCGPCPGTDQDYDGVIDSYDNCPTTANPAQYDCDNDGIGDSCDSLNGTQATITSQTVISAQQFGSQCHFSQNGPREFAYYDIVVRTCYGTRTTYCDGQTADSWSGDCGDSQRRCYKVTSRGCEIVHTYLPYSACPF
ncbi:MAG TPA: thrombospondin type 3 repeat-containing protein [Thermoanaerobaculia bacterium]